MTANQDAGNSDVGRPLVWPHSILSGAHGLQFGSHDSRLLETALPRISRTTGYERANWRIVEKDVQAMNRVLAMSGLSECILSGDLLDALPEKKSDKNRIFETIHEANRIMWLLATSDPEKVMKHLPANWGSKGYRNVCIAVLPGCCADDNRAMIEALKMLPCSHRAMIVRRRSLPVVPDDWHTGIHWVIEIDDRFGDSAVGNPNQPELIRGMCIKHGIPYFYIPSTADGSDLAHHPFNCPLNLFEASPFARLNKVNESKTSAQLTAMDVAVTNSPNSLVAMKTDLPKSDFAVSLAEAHAVLTSDSLTTYAVPPDSALPQHSTDVNKDEAKSQRFKKLDAIVRAGIRAQFDSGFAFLEIRRDELWREADYSSWNDYCATMIELGRNYVNRLIRFAEITQEIIDLGPPATADGKLILPACESQIRPLKRLPDRKSRSKAWGLAVKRAGGMPTAKIVNEFVGEILLRSVTAKPSPPRSELRRELLIQLQDAVSAAVSWEHVRDLVLRLKALGF